ncbi:4'-phosphopantetheinyl transferase superfamily protein [Curtobacterium sp. HSID17257]|uniref:4'-phosphopantetheinyl transferase family protein n=1 Tax=Curtobacterium sp. HSID17257 TaxID=2419510 RepID=UPI000F867910|nr:4'-phosphopantetheinyl transferase superfamily protein [Curtobacterium sp. HSID17257]RUQ02282.1 4-phosphopantetheinyl transferase family protein [Curtobacterium sp. HSID17257]
MVRPSGVVRVTIVPSGADREALVTAVASAHHVDEVAVRTGRRCPHCGSTEHGRPWATIADRRVPVSLARTPARRPGVPGVTAIAVVTGPARGVAVGIDLERVDRVAAAPLDVSTPVEAARLRDDHDRAAAWAVKEAVLKRDGRGLQVDPAAVEVDLARGAARFARRDHLVTVHWPAPDTVLAVAAGGLPVIVEHRLVDGLVDGLGDGRGAGVSGPVG